MGEFYDDFDQETEVVERTRDTKIDDAKEVLMEKFFKKQPDRVFYGRQIEVLLEDVFYHWITAKAVRELMREKRIRSELIELEGPSNVRFFWSNRNRYWKRETKNVRKLILAYSQPELAGGLGKQAEMLFSAALPRVGFMPTAKDVRAYKGKEWTATEHDLDRVFERDGIAYGTEIKNRLSYIDLEELEIKLEICEELGLKPLFIMRAAAKDYIYRVIKAGGFALIFKYQFYPYGHEEVMKEVRERLGLPVDCPREVADATVERFLKWHLKEHGLERV